MSPLQKHDSQSAMIRVQYEQANSRQGVGKRAASHFIHFLTAQATRTTAAGSETNDSECKTV